MKHASGVMKRHVGGVILVTASVSGMVGGAGSHAYSAAKASVISLIENVAAELGPDRIRVLGIAPGVISTPLVHRGRRNTRCSWAPALARPRRGGHRRRHCSVSDEAPHHRRNDQGRRWPAGAGRGAVGRRRR
jgi:NAD(P)-dependent dehydrogenase (short-subunit alcohol dehydrogenase family)